MLFFKNWSQYYRWDDNRSYGDKVSDYIVFPNAPITEAILDIRAELPDGVDLSTFEEFQENIKDRFQERKTRHSYQAEFKFTPGKEESAPIIPKGGADGYFFRSTNENKVVQTRLDGFSFNKLKPYEDWAKFSTEAFHLWQLYKGITKPIRVIRIALRYINRIEIPTHFADFNEYILTNPQIAPGLPQALAHFFMRIEVPNDEIGAMAIITETLQKPTELGKLPLIFDIDVVKRDSYTGDMTEIWPDFEQLRAFKNAIFFNSITEKTKELFK